MNSKTKTEIKILLWITALFILLGLFKTQGILNVEAVEAPPERYTYLPQNADKTELTIPEQIRIIARQQGFEDADYLIDLAWCESRWDTRATNLNKGHSLDIGLFQWNMHYHPEVGIDCALDVECATIKTIEALNAGHHRWWMCDALI